MAIRASKNDNLGILQAFITFKDSHSGEIKTLNFNFHGHGISAPFLSIDTDNITGEVKVEFSGYRDSSDPYLLVRDYGKDDSKDVSPTDALEIIRKSIEKLDP